MTERRTILRVCQDCGGQHEQEEGILNTKRAKEKTLVYIQTSDYNPRPGEVKLSGDARNSGCAAQSAVAAGSER